MKNTLLAITLGIVAIALGAGTALFSMKIIGANTDYMLSNGPWLVNPVMDLKDVHQRAMVARVGLFALRETEVLYYVAAVDSDGDRITSDHDYVLEGTIPDARYWSYTLYGADDFLIPNEKKIYGFNTATIDFEAPDLSNPEFSGIAEKSYQIVIGREQSEGNWLPSGDNNQLSILLRLYQPSPEVYQNLTTTPLPTIRKVK